MSSGASGLGADPDGGRRRNWLLMHDTPTTVYEERSVRCETKAGLRARPPTSCRAIRRSAFRNAMELKRCAQRAMCGAAAAAADPGLNPGSSCSTTASLSRRMPSATAKFSPTRGWISLRRSGRTRPCSHGASSIKSSVSGASVPAESGTQTSRASSAGTPSAGLSATINRSKPRACSRRTSVARAFVDGSGLFFSSLSQRATASSFGRSEAPSALRRSV
mmetsp:Transcript_30273/g.98438  ORF Transcript_30273/g.98438 Transcript_30273/m.98438 type:complete len:220 (+) Transcript_30273:994-1653(+)